MSRPMIPPFVPKSDIERVEALCDSRHKRDVEARHAMQDRLNTHMVKLSQHEVRLDQLEKVERRNKLLLVGWILLTAINCALLAYRITTG